jgi:hypothetical protein
LALGDTFSFSCSNASSTVREKGYPRTSLAHSAVPVSLDGLDDQLGAHPIKSLIIGGQGTYVPFPSHSLLTPVGPTVWVLMLDCRRVKHNLGQYAPLMLDLSERNESWGKCVVWKSTERSLNDYMHCHLGCSIS